MNEIELKLVFSVFCPFLEKRVEFSNWTCNNLPFCSGKEDVCFNHRPGCILPKKPFEVNSGNCGKCGKEVVANECDVYSCDCGYVGNILFSQKSDDSG
jgi:hypothetical protein